MSVEHYKPRNYEWGFVTRPDHRSKGAARRVLTNASRARLKRVWREFDEKQAKGKR